MPWRQPPSALRALARLHSGSDLFEEPDDILAHVRQADNDVVVVDVAERGVVPALPPRLLQHQIPAVDSGHEVLVPSETERKADEQAVGCCMTKHFFFFFGVRIAAVWLKTKRKLPPSEGTIDWWRFWGSKHQEFLACEESHEEKQRKEKKEKKGADVDTHTHTHTRLAL